MSADTSKTIEIALNVVGMSAAKIKSVTSAFDKIKTAVDTTITAVDNLQSALNKVKAPPKLAAFTASLNAISKIKDFKGLTKFSESVQALSSTKIPSIARFVTSLTKLSGITIPNLTALIRNLGKLAELELKNFNSQVNIIVKGLKKLTEISTSRLEKIAKSLEVLSKVSLNKAVNDAKKLTDALKKLEKTAQTTGVRLKGFKQKVETVFQFRLISQALLFLKDGIINAVIAIGQYDQALKDLQAITGATTTEIAQMGTKILEVASKTKFSASEVAEGMRIIGQAGFSAGEAVETMQAVSDLATGTLSAMASTVDLVTTAMRVFSIEATRSSEVADTFANAVNKSKLTVDKLRTSMNYIGPIAKSAGVTFQELSASMMVLANSGLRASKIGTGLRRVFAELVDPSKKLREAARNAGVALSDLDPQSTNLSTVIKNLGLVVNDTQVAFDVFGKRGAAAVLTLSNSQSAFDEMLQTVQKSGTAANMASIQMEGLAVSFKNLKDKLGLLAIAIGKAGIADAMKMLVDIARNLVDVLTFLIDNTLVEFLGKAVLVTGALFGILAALKALLAVETFVILGAAFAKLTAAATGTAVAVGAVGATAHAAFPPLLVISGIIAAIAGGMYMLSDRSKKASDEALKLASEYKNLGTHMRDYEAKVSTMKAGSNELKEANIALRTKLMDVAKEYDELSIYAFKAVHAINPLTGYIDDNSTALATLNEKIKELRMTELAESVEESNKSFAKQTGFIKRIFNQFGDVAKTAKLIFTDNDAYQHLRKIRQEAHQMSIDLHSGVKNFADLHKYIAKIDHKNLTAQQEVLKEQYISMMFNATTWYETLKNSGEISLTNTVEEISNIAASAGLTGQSLEALLVYIDELKQSGVGDYETIIDKWAHDAKEGKQLLSSHIEDYKKLGLVIADADASRLKFAEGQKQALMDSRKALEDWKNGQISSGNESKEMWEKYYKDLAQLEVEARKVTADQAQHESTQTMLAIEKELAAHADKLAKIEKMENTSLQVRAKKRQQANTELEKNLASITKNSFDPQELLAATKEQELIIKNSYKRQQSMIELSLIERGESHATITEELKKLELQSSKEVVDLWRKANQTIVDQGNPDTNPNVRSIKAKQLAAELAHVKATSAARIQLMEEGIKQQNQLYEDANIQRELNHTEFLARMVKQEMASGTATEEIEKKKLKLSLKLAEDRLVATQHHFDEAKELYKQDSEEYKSRQEEFLSARIAFLEESLAYTEKYAQLEYAVEKAKIEAVIQLDKAIHASDSAVQKARIDSAKTILKASYDSMRITHQKYYATKKADQEQSFRDEVAILKKLRAKHKAELENLHNIAVSEKERTETKLRLDKTVLSITTEIRKLQEAQPGVLAAIDAAELKAIDTSEKKIASILKQFRTMKSASDIELFSSSGDLKKQQKVQMDSLKAVTDEKLRLLKIAVDRDLSSTNELKEAKKIADRLINNLREKHGKERLEQTLKDQDTEFESFRVKSELAHTKSLEEMVARELKAGTSFENIEKKKAKMALDFLEERKIAAEKHFENAKLLYNKDLDAYRQRQDDAAKASEAFYKTRLGYTEKYAKLEYNIERNKIKSIIELNRATYTRDSKLQQVAIDNSLKMLKASYNSKAVAHEAYYDGLHNTANKNHQEDLDRLRVLEQAQTYQLAQLRASSKKGIDTTNAQALAEKELGAIREERKLLEANLPGILAGIDVARLKSIDTSNKSIDSITNQIKKLTSTSEMNLYGNPGELEKAHKIQMANLEEIIKTKRDALEQEVRLNPERKGALANAEAQFIAMRNNLDAKQQQEKHERTLKYQDMAFDSFKKKSALQHSARLKEIAKEQVAGDITKDEAEKQELLAKVAHFKRIYVEAVKHQDKLTDLDSDDSIKARLDKTLSAHKKYYDALKELKLGSAEIDEEMDKARFEAALDKSKSDSDLSMLKQTEATKTALDENKSLLDQGLIDAQEYYDERNRIAKEDIHKQLDILDAEEKIFKARMKLQIAKSDGKEKIDLEKKLSAVLKATEAERVKFTEGYNREVIQNDTAKFKDMEENIKRFDVIFKQAAMDRMAVAEEEWRLGIISAKEYSEAVEAAFLVGSLSAEEFRKKKLLADGDVFKNFEEGVKNGMKGVQTLNEFMQSAGEEMFNAFGTGMADAMYGFVSGTKSAKEAFGDFAASFMQMVTKMIIKMMVMKALQSVFGMGMAEGGEVPAAGSYTAGATTSLASGGEIPGFSPTSTADNIPILATAGEYMQPVSAVKKYGMRVMNAIRTLSIPKKSLTNLIQGTALGLGAPLPSFALASGGSVPASNFQSSSVGDIVKAMKNSKEKATPVTIMNVVDPKEMLHSALATPEGQGALLNFVSARSGTISTILKQ